MRQAYPRALSSDRTVLHPHTTDNAYIEAFNARLRAECLNENWFLSLEDAREKVEAWRKDYNGERPHGVLGNLAPEEFVLAATAEAR